MAKLTLDDISSGYLSTVKYNSNNALTEAALENTLSRDGTSPNGMNADIDMNTHKIINLEAPESANDAARWIDVTDAVELTGQAVPSLTGNSQKYLGNDGATLGWKHFYDQTGAESTAMVTPTDYRYPPLNVLRYGTNTTPGTTDMAAAAQAAIDVAIAAGGETVYFPEGTYLINTTLEITGAISGVHIKGAGQYSTIVKSGIVGAAAEPLLKNDASGNYFVISDIELRGNGLTGASGNGNGVSCINPGGVLYPQRVALHNVTIRDFLGTGQNEVAASIPSCGFFAYKSTGYVLENVTIYQCATGLRYHDMENCVTTGATIDACTYNDVWLDDCHAINFIGCTIQSAGSGGATDGNVYFTDCESVSFIGGEIKNGDPYLVNLRGAAVVNRSILFKGVYFAQLDDTNYGVTCVSVNNATINLAIENSYFLFVNTITTGLGIEVIQAVGGYSCTGLRIVGNSFLIGAGGTITSCIHLNVTSNRVYAPLIESNEIGWQTSTASATTITNGILLDGRVEGGLIQANSFMAGTNVTITDAIEIASANVLALKLNANEYAGFGTITNQVNNSASVSYERTERASGRIYTGSATYDPASLADGAGATTTVTVTGAALGDYVENVSFSLDLQGITLTAWVSAANTVSVRFQNESGGVLDLGSGTLRAKVRTQ